MHGKLLGDTAISLAPFLGVQYNTHYNIESVRYNDILCISLVLIKLKRKRESS